MVSFRHHVVQSGLLNQSWTRFFTVNIKLYCRYLCGHIAYRVRMNERRTGACGLIVHTNVYTANYIQRLPTV